MQRKNKYHLCPSDSRFRLPSQPRKMLVTPEMAEDWYNCRNDDALNRTSSPKFVQKMVGVIRRNEWMTTHQGFAFDTDGWLLDGAQRCLAIQASGKAVEVWVHPDMPRDTFVAMDSGRSRQAAQFLRGMANPNVIASAARHLARAERAQYDKVVRLSRSPVLDLTNHQVLEVVRSWPELGEALRDASRCRSGANIPITQCTALLAQVRRSEHVDMMSDWLNAVATGDFIGGNDPRKRIRNAFLTPTQRKISTGTKGQAYSLLVKSWNAFVEGRDVGLLGWKENELIPEVLDVKWPSPVELGEG